MALPTPSVTITSIAEMVCGSTCWDRMRTCEVPMLRYASMNGRLQIAITWARMTRA
jgi:hypothetical protein